MNPRDRKDIGKAKAEIRALITDDPFCDVSALVQIIDQRSRDEAIGIIREIFAAQESTHRAIFVDDYLLGVHTKE